MENKELGQKQANRVELDKNLEKYDQLVQNSEENASLKTIAKSFLTVNYLENRFIFILFKIYL